MHNSFQITAARVSLEGEGEMEGRLSEPQLRTPVSSCFNLIRIFIHLSFFA